MFCSYVWDLTGFMSNNPVVMSGLLGATVAAGISLYGVSRANASSLARLHVQHEHDLLEADRQRVHDAAQKEEDRKAAIRREVYTKAVEAAHGFLGYVGRLPDIRLGQPDEDAPLQTLLQANSKVWLVAEAEAAHLSRELASKAGELFLAVRAQVQPLRLAKEPWWELGELLENAQAELRRTHAASAQAREQGLPSGLLEAHGKSFADAGTFFRYLKDQRTRIEGEVAAMRVAQLTQTIDLLRPMQELLVELVSSLRKELGLPPDLEEFQRQLADQEARMRRALDKLIKGV